MFSIFDNITTTSWLPNAFTNMIVNSSLPHGNQMPKGTFIQDLLLTCMISNNFVSDLTQEYERFLHFDNIITTSWLTNALIVNSSLPHGNQMPKGTFIQDLLLTSYK